MLAEEGLEAAWRRHAENHAALVDGLEKIGVAMFVEPAYRLPELNLVCVPEGIDDAWVRSEALKRYGLELGNGLGVLAGKVWRIGLMGTLSTPQNVQLCLEVLETLLGESAQA
jgi:alanine-glyoxylate transaminase/serine-glyoxylate transaminase/serine-pyruvate transaminase